MWIILFSRNNLIGNKSKKQLISDKFDLVSFFLIPLLAQVSIKYGTEGRTRTDTVLPPLDFESSASTSSATPANKWKLL